MQQKSNKKDKMSEVIKAMSTEKSVVSLGKMLIDDPELLGQTLSSIITEVSFLRIDNELHKRNTEMFVKFLQICSNKDSSLDTMVSGLTEEIKKIKNQISQNPYCKCGHNIGEHTGNGNCTQCQCKTYESKGGGR